MSDPLTMTAGDALLAQLKRIGVDYVFANSGIDFPPIIEGLGRGRRQRYRTAPGHHHSP